MLGIWRTVTLLNVANLQLYVNLSLQGEWETADGQAVAKSGRIKLFNSKTGTLKQSVFPACKSPGQRPRLCSVGLRLGQLNAQLFGCGNQVGQGRNHFAPLPCFQTAIRIYPQPFGRNTLGSFPDQIDDVFLAGNVG